VSFVRLEISVSQMQSPLCDTAMTRSSNARGL